MPTKHTVTALIIGVALAACTYLRTGDLSGDVLVAAPSEQIVRGADVGVTLVGATDKFEDDWKKAGEDFEKKYTEARSASKLAASNLKDARENYDYVLEVRRSFAKGALEKARKGLQEAMDGQQAAASRARGVVEEYISRTEGLIKAHQTKTVRTDANGHYEIKGLPPAKYYVCARLEVSGAPLYWRVPVEIKPGPQKVDLSRRNAGSPLGDRLGLVAW